MRTGRDIFETTRAVAECLEHPWPTWDKLTAEEKADYELQAFEQDARDREVTYAHSE